MLPVGILYALNPKTLFVKKFVGTRTMLLIRRIMRRYIYHLLYDLGMNSFFLMAVKNASPIINNRKNIEIRRMIANP